MNNNANNNANNNNANNNNKRFNVDSANNNSNNNNVVVVRNNRKNNNQNKDHHMIITQLFRMVTQLKLYHWQTPSYARHQASDNFINTFMGKFDEFIEVYQGKYGVIRMKASKREIVIEDLDDNQIITFCESMRDYLDSGITAYLDPESDHDLYNIRDELLAMLNKMLYLFTLS